MQVKSDSRAARQRRGMPIALLVARVLFASIFILAAPRHFTSEAVTHAAELGVPFARFVVPLAGAMAMIGGLGVLAGYQTRWSAVLLVAFLVPVTFGMHRFWESTDPAAFAVQRAMFFKNVALVGGALAIACAGAGAWSLDVGLR